MGANIWGKYLSGASKAAILALYASAGGAEAVGYGSTTVAAALDALESPFVNVMSLIPKSQHAAIWDGTSVYDASDVIQAGLVDKKRLLVPAGVTLVAKNLKSVEKGALVCVIGRATIRTPAGTGLHAIRVNSEGFSLGGINFDGGNNGPYAVAGAVIGTRHGVILGDEFGTGAQLHGITIRDVDIYGFDHTGLSGRELQNGFVFGKRAVLDNVNAYSNYANWWMNPRCEYVTATNCYGYEGFAGIIQQAGNNTFAASHFENNWQNCQMATGENDAHGQFLGCSFNHAKGYGLYAIGIKNGHTFTGCAFWYAPIHLEDCTGISIRSSQIASSHVTVVGGGVNSIDDNYTPTGLTKTLTGYTFTSFRNNRTSATDLSHQPVYGDLAAQASASDYAYPISFNASGALPLVFDLKKWHGEDADFLVTAGSLYIPRTDYYTLDARITFDVAASDEYVTVSLVRYTGATAVEQVIDSREFKAGRLGCTVAVTSRMLCQNGDRIEVHLKTATVAGITINAGGIKFRANSDD